MTADHYYLQIQEAKAYIETMWEGLFPDTVLMTGTGLANIADEVEILKEIPYRSIPHFPVSTVESHKGTLVIANVGRNQVAILAGRWHYYEGYSAKELTLPVRVMKALSVERMLFTNVAGGVNETYEAGDLVIIKDHINTIPDHPLRGANDDRLGLRFPDMLHTYSHQLVSNISDIAQGLNIPIRQGVYYALQGPSLETPAEYKMIHILGADLVGMSTVPEVIVARHAGMQVAAISIVSNVCYPPERITETTIAEVIAVAQVASKKLNQILLHLLAQ